MPTLSLNISEAEIERLSYERYAYPQPMIQKRIFALYLKATTLYSNVQIGTIVGLHANTVAQWLARYQGGGFEALLTNNYGTNQSELEAHSNSLLASFIEVPPRTAAEAAERIREMTGIERSVQQARVWMKRQGLRFIKCGHLPAKGDSEEQKDWMLQKLEPTLKLALKGKIHLLYVDAAHLVLQPFLCSLWCLVKCFIKAGSGRTRVNVLGAVDAMSKKVVTLINTTYITADTLVAFLKLLKKRFGNLPIKIVLDNARYQHCLLVETAARQLGIELIFLPAYSPNLNLIERLWKFTKNKILYARYFDKPKEFQAAIENFFKNINKDYKKELNSLLTLNFHIYDKDNSLIYPL